MAQRPENNDALVRQAEVVISFILRAGVVVSGVIIALGSLLYFIEAARQPHGPHATSHELTAIGGIAHALLTGDPLAIIMLGLILLLLTPVLRVIVSIGAFALERDWRYVAITSLVLIILIISFLLGKGGA